MEYCCHVWAGAPSCYLNMQDKLQKRACWTVVPTLAVSLEPLGHLRNVANSSFFYIYCFGRCSSEWAELVDFLILVEDSLVVPINWVISLSPFLDVITTFMSIVSLFAKLDYGIVFLQNAFF